MRFVKLIKKRADIKKVLLRISCDRRLPSNGVCYEQLRQSKDG